MTDQVQLPNATPCCRESGTIRLQIYLG
jgi:hypothetical protein